MAGPGMFQSQNLSLQQVLAPQLQQSLLILQAPLLELRNLVQQEMETNPSSRSWPSRPTKSARFPRASRRKIISRRNSIGWPSSTTSGAITWRNRAATAVARQEDEEKRQFFFDSLAKEETLQQHLVEQLNQTALERGRPQDRGTHHRQHRRQWFSPVDAGRDRDEHRHRAGRFRAHARRSSRAFTRPASARAICASAC